MARLTVVFWRDIPAQVLEGKGRSALRVHLDARFEAAIDRAAMAAGLAGTDDYLAQWRRRSAEADSAAVLAARIEAEYDPDRLRALAAAGGRDPRMTQG
ncbi:virulence factor [Paracoccus spongiarum]|uniref:Virulence factor n=1 Tax=Paracoccus spongiarum TaxID=3064387 RepID=A0ABT9JD84_9RHOB|nr:virulence factor [Paracoccus sp. 2205BS29-5]MDP5307777.1 virulence factor [Paracoccus sp. 2205BS29-5]